MLTLDELLHPVTPAEFRAAYEDRKPLHVPAGDDDRKRRLLDWAAFNQLLNQADIWTPTTLGLMRNRVAVPPEQFFQFITSDAGQTIRLSPRKLEVFLSAGCSLIANQVGFLHPPIAHLSEALSRRWGAHVGANIYCSFSGVQAFGPHFDIHDVFAVQTEGEKVWRLYENRAEAPLEAFKDPAEARRVFEQGHGPLMTEVRMRPGDVLYVPRGWYHDALTHDGESLHVTLSVTPLSGPSVMKLLNAAALQDPEFRAWLPPAWDEDGASLKASLAGIGRILTRLIESEAFATEIAMAQQAAIRAPADFTLPARKPVTLMRVTGRAFPASSVAVRKAYMWAQDERVFAVEDMIAQFDGLSEADIRAAVDAALAAGAIAPEPRR